MPDENILLRLTLNPVDTLFFRDARPFGPASQAESVLPMPQTLAGAFRTLLLERHGVDLGGISARVKDTGSFSAALAGMDDEVASIADVQISGPWIIHNRELLVRTPANLRREKGSDSRRQKVFRLDPRKTAPPGWRPQSQGMLPLWRYGRESVEAVNEYLRPKGLRQFLQGDTPDSSELVSAGDLYGVDRRVGIGIDASRRTAREGQIYSAGMLSLKPRVAFYSEVRGPRATLSPLGASQVLMRFGGEGRYVEIKPANLRSDWPQAPEYSGEGKLALLTTPAWLNGWKPSGIAPVAAAVGGYEAISGWDIAKGGPKPNRFMVPAGTVYFLPPGDDMPGALVNQGDATVGWGHFLEGNWKYV